jgi:hypothetical protein
VIAILNRENSEKTISLKLSEANSSAIKIYETSEQHDLSYLGDFKISNEIIVAPKSVTTMVFKL